MNNPLVSILIPVYNVEAYLPQCLDSVLGQTYKNLQIVLIDDGSKDDSWKIMQDYAAKDARIEIYHQENQGVAATRNHLLEKIKGEYVLFVDSDDWVETEMVEVLLNQILKHDADIINCANVLEQKLKVFNKVEIWDQSKVVYEFLKHADFCGQLCNKLLKTTLVHTERFQHEISYGEDALFLWHVLQKVSKCIVIDEQLYHYRKNDMSLSHRKWTPSGKGSGHEVWKQIAEDTKELWPQYRDIAIANYAISDMWQIYYACQSNYPKDGNITLFQENIRNHLPLIYRSGLINLKKMIFATIAAYCFRCCRLLVK